MRTDDWDQPRPAAVYRPTIESDWEEILQRYQPSCNDSPIRRCFAVARENRAQTVVVETRYIDRDYRSEYSAYYSRIFRSMPDSAHRIHFFSESIPTGQLTDLPSSAAYLGYIVVRPSTTGPVARAMLVPPPDVIDAVRTSQVETVHLFGQALTIRAAPFSQQDASLGACAHAAAWMCYQTAVLRADVARRVTADFALQADPRMARYRTVPTEGLTPEQLSDLFRKFGLPASYYEVGELPPQQLSWAPADPVRKRGRAPGSWDSRSISVSCRYLTSGFPVIVGTADHAFVLVGWRRKKADSSEIELIRHDDQVGPYLLIEDVLNDTAVDPATGAQIAYGPWQTLHVPMPEKLWLAPEPAENAAGVELVDISTAVGRDRLTAGRDPVTTLSELIDQNRLALRTYAQSANQYKANLEMRGFPRRTIREYRFARFSRYIWVVEAIDRSFRRAGQPCVLGEIVFDATSSGVDPKKLAIRVHGAVWVSQGDENYRGPVLDDPTPVRVGGRGPA